MFNQGFSQELDQDRVRSQLLAEDGVVRASLARYNTAAEVERLIAALDEIL
jgi:selenocysteine lyase/cysteine desulfurase